MVEAVSGKIHSTEKFISQIYYLLGYGFTISLDFRCYLGVASDCELRAENHLEHYLLMCESSQILYNSNYCNIIIVI